MILRKKLCYNESSQVMANCDTVLLLVMCSVNRQVMTKLRTVILVVWPQNIRCLIMNYRDKCDSTSNTHIIILFYYRILLHVALSTVSTSQGPVYYAFEVSDYSFQQFFLNSPIILRNIPVLTYYSQYYSQLFKAHIFVFVIYNSIYKVASYSF